MGDTSISSEEKSPEDALAALYDAIERRDPDAARPLCTGDLVFIDEEGEADGKDAIELMFWWLDRLPERGTRQRIITWHSVEVEILGHVALVSAWGIVLYETALGDSEHPYRLTGLLVQASNQWLWRIHHASIPDAF